ncbi:DUF6415 family natural product biosynthesis protein [Streptomyces sp. NPDC051320]|uniref:DUF6415 family natural product biosynthesis protein n=1 Tax=Streptomyces sp. NPDC051320 TaxID=3154644 RepID=UPI00343EDCB9
MHESTVQPDHPARDPRPLDILTMRATAAEALADDADIPTLDHLQTLTWMLRGHLALLIPEVAVLACERPQDDVWRAAAQAGLGEARRRLEVTQGGQLPVVLRHAQHLARSVNALCTHLENLAVCDA